LAEHDFEPTLTEFSKVQSGVVRCHDLCANIDLLMIVGHILDITGMVDPGVGD
jgi:hypothetical protein